MAFDAARANCLAKWSKSCSTSAYGQRIWKVATCEEVPPVLAAGIAVGEGALCCQSLWPKSVFDAPGASAPELVGSRLAAVTNGCRCGSDPDGNSKALLGDMPKAVRSAAAAAASPVAAAPQAPPEFALNPAPSALGAETAPRPVVGGPGHGAPLPAPAVPHVAASAPAPVSEAVGLGQPPPKVEEAAVAIARPPSAGSAAADAAGKAAKSSWEAHFLSFFFFFSFLEPASDPAVIPLLKRCGPRASTSSDGVSRAPSASGCSEDLALLRSAPAGDGPAAGPPAAEAAQA